VLTTSTALARVAFTQKSEWIFRATQKGAKAEQEGKVLTAN
jgi:hypothetical protein